MTRVETAFAALPPPRTRCTSSIALPARDESASIARALAALVAQRSADGAPLDPGTYEILVFANGCADDTAAVAEAVRDAHPGHAIFVVVADRGAPECAHVGTARRAVMDAAAARMLATSRPEAAVLTTDADTVVAPDWIARTVAALCDADAIAGRIVMDPNEAAALDPRLQTAYALQARYEFARVRLETLLDPLSHDPWPRHPQHFGASFAVRAATYREAGGLPVRDRLEDLAFYHALLRIDARVRHSMDVRVTTSARLDCRVTGGLGTFLRDLLTSARGGTPLLVEHPVTTREIIEARAALRRWWHGRDRITAPAQRALVVRRLGLDEAAWHAHVAHAAAFGAAFEAVHEHALRGGLATRRPRVPVAAALAGVDDQCRALRSSAAPATRRTARSGAG